MDDLNTTDLPTSTAVAIEAGRRLALSANTSPLRHGLPYVVLRDQNGREAIEYFSQAAQEIARLEGHATMHDLDSFLMFWDEHQQPPSRVFAEMSPSVRFTAVFDEHGSFTRTADWREFRCQYAPAYAPEWLAWRDKDRKDWPSNEAFALWLEDQLPDIVSPPADELLQIINTFRVDESHSWSNDVTLANGKIDMQYKKHVDGHASANGGRVAIPEIIGLRLPVWAGLDAKTYELQARFRYRLREGRLTMRYELVRPHKIVELAFRDMVARINTHTQNRMYFGSPEF